MDIKGILEQLEKYLEENLAAKSLPIFEDIVLREAEAYPGTLESEMDDFIFSKKKPSFKSLLFRYIDERNLIDS